MLGVVIGVAAVISMTALGEGAQAEVQQQIQKLGARLLIVAPGSASSGAAQLGRGTRPSLTDAQLAKIRQLAGVEIAAPVTHRVSQVVAGNRNWPTNVLGNNGDYVIAREWALEYGRPFSADEVRAAAKVAIIGNLVAERLFGKAAPVGQNIRIGATPFTVVGVLEPKGKSLSGSQDDDSVIIPLTTFRARGGGQNEPFRSLNFILVKGAPTVEISVLKEAVRDALNGYSQVRRANGDFLIENPADTLAAHKSAKETFRWLVASIAAVSLAVGGISITNTMLVSVTERTREIGIRMAVGARPRDIRVQFLAEALVIALIGGALGLLLGWAAATAIAFFAEWPVLIGLGEVVLALSCSVAAGIFSGLYPAYTASNLAPVEALRSD